MLMQISMSSALRNLVYHFITRKVFLWEGAGNYIQSPFVYNDNSVNAEREKPENTSVYHCLLHSYRVEIRIQIQLTEVITAALLAECKNIRIL